jgi:hypothetical protein
MGRAYHRSVLARFNLWQPASVRQRNGRLERPPIPARLQTRLRPRSPCRSQPTCASAAVGRLSRRTGHTTCEGLGFRCRWLYRKCGRPIGAVLGLVEGCQLLVWSRNELSTRWVCSKMPIERAASVVSSPCRTRFLSVSRWWAISSEAARKSRSTWAKFRSIVTRSIPSA